MLLSSHEFDIFEEHAEVHSGWVLVRVEQHGVGVFDVRQFVGAVVGVVVEGGRQIAVCVFDELQSALVVDIG